MKPHAAAKLDMLEAQSRGEFGNWLKTYQDLGKFTHTRDDWFTIRNKERDSPYFIPVIKGSELRNQILHLQAAGCEPSTMYIQDIPHPDSARLIQGEVCRQPDYWLRYSLHPTLNLRDAMNADQVLEAIQRHQAAKEREKEAVSE